MQEIIEQYRALLENISLARQVNDSLANKLISEFCERLEGQLMLLNEIRQDREIAKSVHNKLEIISETLTERASGFYAIIPNAFEFKEFLLRCHEETNLAFINNQIPRACRNAFRQIETLVDYIVISANLIEWLLDRPSVEWANYKVYVSPNASRFENIQIIIKSIALANKIWLINNYFIEYFRRHAECKRALTNVYDRNKYFSCYNLRNADSHGWNFKTTSDTQLQKLEEVKRDFENHLRELTKIIVPLRDLAASITTKDIYHPPPQ